LLAGRVGVARVRVLVSPAHLVLAGAPTSTARGVIVPLKCSGSAGQSCTVTAVLVTIEKLRRSKPIAVAAAVKTIKKTVIVGTRTTTIAAGKTLKLLVSLKPVGKRLLKRFKKLPVQLTVTTVVAVKRTTVATRKVVIRQKKRK
jgi:hypothetical protein